MDGSLTSRLAHPSYKAVPIDTEAPDSESLPQHSDSDPAAPLDARARWSPFNKPDLHERERLQFSLVGLQNTQYEPVFEPGVADTGSSTTSDKRSGKSDKRRERWWKWKDAVNRWWLFELLAIILSMACFVALVIVLRVSAGKEPTRWLYNRLTLNGLIALLSTFMRASMMLGVGAGLSQMKWNHFSPSSQGPRGQRLENLDTFDQASRGPLGSIMLLFARAKPHLGLIGALITILTLAFDAFAQEVIIVRYENRPGINGTYIGQVDRSERYDQWTKVNLEVEWTTDLATVAAEYNGIFNYQNIAAPVARCSTGNCTWPVVPSLSVCGSCTNLTSAMTHTCVGNVNKTSYADTRNCTYTLAEGTQDSYPPKPGYKFWTTRSGDSRDGSEVLAYIVVGGYTTHHYNKSDIAYIDKWLMINASQHPATASACALWFCVQAYNTSIKNGIPTQTIIGNWSETNKTNVPSNSDGWIGFTNVPNEIRQGTDYAVNWGSVIAFSDQPIFQNANITYGDDDIDFFIYSSTIVRSLFNIPNYDDWIDQMALGMGNNVRATGYSNTPADRYEGEVLASVPLVHVRWPWLAFPAGMVTASLLFIIASIWQTSHLRIEPWKGDALAMLLASTDENIQRDSGDMWKVEKARVWLDSSGDNAFFRKLAADKT